LLTLNNEEFNLLCLLKHRLFTPFEVIVNQIYSGSFEKASIVVDVLIERNMIEIIYGRVTMTAVGKEATKKEQIKRKATIFMILEVAE
jgi:hypothetical protein